MSLSSKNSCLPLCGTATRGLLIHRYSYFLYKTQTQEHLIEQQSTLCTFLYQEQSNLNVYIFYRLMIQNSWSNKLHQEPKLATIVKIPNSTVIYQNQSNQLIAHSTTETSPLPIRKDILSIASFPTGQILLLSRYQLLCFDLLNNNELFSLQFQNAQKLFVEDDQIFVICGSDLFCYNFQGEEKYVNHCSAVIQTLATVVIKQKMQVVVGFNDLTMTRYRGVNISFDYGKIFGIPSSISSIGESIIVGSQEGTVGYFQGKKSKWKAKSSHPVFKIITHRTESDYLAIIIRPHGLIQIKDWKGKGETLHKLKLNEQVIASCIHDFRQQDNEQLVCITKAGNIKGLNLYEQAKKVEKKQIVDEIVLEFQNSEVLEAEKLNLEFEIKQLKEILEKESSEKRQDNEQIQPQEILSKNFNFQTYLHHETQGLVLQVNCYNGFISGLTFEEPIMPVLYDKLQSIKYVFKAQNIVFGQITCILLVHSSYTSKIYEAKIFKITLPKFWKFNELEKDKAQPKINGGIKFALVERNARYVKWIYQCFFMKWTQQQKTKLQSCNPLKVRFYNAYDKIDLQFIFLHKEGKVQIWSECLKTLGEVFQDLIEYVGIQELNSELSFNRQKQKLKETLNIIERLSQAKVSISSEMAQAIDNIKFLLVKGQSARCVGSMKDLRKTYSEIMGFNRSLLTQIQKKNANTKQLSEQLKSLGQFINQAANVRYGKAKEGVIAACRESIKKKQFPNILSIMERGHLNV